ncbi:MAG: hypothetical protein OEY49_02340 [Candidatus Heimdallarchaeota archaeon]|nr:hypothetical protein [Candidatus Heimdallarchaeota archaeon]
MAVTFHSTSFYLSRWTEEKKEQEQPRELVQIQNDYAEKPDMRKVCSGYGCVLYYETSISQYRSEGNCKRNSLCTEVRILKDNLFVEKGSVSNTIHAINFEKQLKTW